MSQVIRYLLCAVTLTALIAGAIGCSAQGAEPLPPQPRLRVATTTSLYDTGLWSYLEPMFEKQYGVELDVLSAGTGIALEYGRRGDVSAVVIHDPAGEAKFVADGYGIKRVPFAYNYFVIAGPKSDPAGLKGLSPEGAFQKLFESGKGTFVSRGDDSGTHAKEKTIWKRTGIDYEAVRRASTWYIEAGRGMGATLLMASEKQAYTLTDMATLLAYKGKLELVPIVDKGGILLNVYSAIAVNPVRHPDTNFGMANNLINFLTSPEIQKLIGSYEVKEYGRPLFVPCAGAEPTS